MYLMINYHLKMLLNMKNHHHYEYIINLCLSVLISLFLFPVLNLGLISFYKYTDQLKIHYFTIWANQKEELFFADDFYQLSTIK